MTEPTRLEVFPVSFFSMVMGLSGLTIAWEKTQSLMGFSAIFNDFLMLLTVLVFMVLATLYLMKLLRHPGAVRDELAHPVKLSFFPTISISLLLLAIAGHPYAPSFCSGLWLLGTTLHFAFMLYILNSWINHPHYKVAHMNPAWFIPAVGNVLIPIGGVGLGYNEVSWFFFSIGMLFWIVLLTIVFNRVLFHEPLPAALEPTLFILIAPPAVGFVSYIKLTGELDQMARMLYYLALFFGIFLLTQAPRLSRLPFFLSWWAYSFPLAAITIASWVMYQTTGLMTFKMIALFFLTIVTLIVSLLVVKTAQAVLANQLTIPE